MTWVDTSTVAVTLLLIATMPVFAVVARHRLPDPDMSTRGHSVMLGRWLREWLVWLITPAERIMVAFRISPTALNVCGLLCGLAAGVALAAEQLAIAGCLTLLGGVADVFDGRVARARGITSKFGAFFDSTLDRFAESLTFLGILFYFANSRTYVLLAAAAMSGSLLVSYVRARGEALGASSPGGLMQRAERLVVLAIGAVADPVVAARFGSHDGVVLGGALGLIAIGTWGTAVWRVVAVSRALNTQSRELPHDKL